MIHDLAHLVVDLHHVVAVQNITGDAVAHGAVRDVLAAGGLLDIQGDGVLVVLAQEDHRQVIDGRHIDGLVERALVGGAVAEEHHGDGILVQVFLGQRGADGDGDAAAHDAVGAQHAHIHIRDMHGAALALAVAGLTSHQLGEHPAQIGALGDAVAVAAVVGNDVVVVGQVGADAHADGLLAVVGVDRRAGQVHLGQLDGLLLKFADGGHPGIQIQQDFLVQLFHVCLMPPIFLAVRR